MQKRSKADKDGGSGMERFHKGQLVHPMYPARCTVKNAAWEVADEDYEPCEFTHGKICKRAGSKGCDPMVIDADLAQKISLRATSFKSFKQDPQTGRPLNPLGRTGMMGRGLLRNWGPNQAGDALVTRMSKDGKHVEFVAIKRGDNGSWAIPGGRLEPGEAVSECVRREFEEEACAVPEQEMGPIRDLLDDIFAKGIVTYRGVVLDPRTTDNAWMETQCFWVHIADDKKARRLTVKGGDDAAEARWLLADDSCDEIRDLFANHREIVLESIANLAPS